MANPIAMELPVEPAPVYAWDALDEQAEREAQAIADRRRLADFDKRQRRHVPGTPERPLQGRTLVHIAKWRAGLTPAEEREVAAVVAMFERERVALDLAKERERCAV